MANKAQVNFKRGTFDNLKALKAANGILDGTFYLTTDTNRLYIGVGTSEYHLINESINLIEKIDTLPAASEANYGKIYLSISENDKQKMNEGPYILVDESLSSSYPIGSQVSVLGISFEVFRYVKGFGEEKIGSLSFAIRHFPQGANPLQIDLAPDIDNIQREIEELNQFNQRISRKGYNVTTSISAFYQAKKAASLLLGIFVFLSVLILVLTFAVLANSIRISEDWNHKNFALYKSLGRKSKDRLGVFVIQISIIYFLS